MKKYVYSIYDSKAKIHNSPFYVLNDQMAVRGCSRLVQDPNSDISFSPGDFTLYKLGTFEDTTGTFEILSPPEQIINLAFIQGLDEENVENAAVSS